MFNIDFTDFIKLYKEYTKEPQLKETTLSSDNPLQFRNNLS